MIKENGKMEGKGCGRRDTRSGGVAHLSIYKCIYTSAYLYIRIIELLTILTIIVKSKRLNMAFGIIIPSICPMPCVHPERCWYKYNKGQCNPIPVRRFIMCGVLLI